jgi:hypothetical protein
MRKIIHTSTAGVSNTASTQCNWITTAICDDGTVWWIRDNDQEWRELTPIPQPGRTMPLADGLVLMSPKEPVGHVDATPDEEYVRRILAAHLDMQQCTIVANPSSMLADQMNYDSARRSVRLRHALAVLTNMTPRAQESLQAALAEVDADWKPHLENISGKMPWASAPPPT